MSQLHIIPTLNRDGSAFRGLVCNVNSTVPFAVFVFNFNTMELTFHQHLEAPKEAAIYAYENAKTDEEREQALLNKLNTPIDYYDIPVYTGAGIKGINPVLAAQMLSHVQDLRALKYKDALNSRRDKQTKKTNERANKADTYLKKTAFSAV